MRMVGGFFHWWVGSHWSLVSILIILGCPLGVYSWKGLMGKGDRRASWKARTKLQRTPALGPSSSKPFFYLNGVDGGGGDVDEDEDDDEGEERQTGGRSWHSALPPTTSHCFLCTAPQCNAGSAKDFLHFFCAFIFFAFFAAHT